MKEKWKNKENAIKESKETISVLEIQLNSYLEYNKKLENNIKNFWKTKRERFQSLKYLIFSFFLNK